MKNKKIIIIISTIIVVIVGLILLIAKNIKREYVVKFNYNCNDKIEEKIVKKGSIVSQPNTVIKDGYVFKGWYLGNIEYDFSNVITKDIILIAKWEEVSDKQYSIIFNSNGGNDILNQEVKESKLVNKPENPIKENYIFKGWYLDDNEYDFSNPVTKNMTLVAKWELKEDMVYYTIKFNNGTSVSTQSVKAGNCVKEPYYPVKEGYLFAGWQLNGNKYNFSSKVTANITLVAKWIPKEKVVIEFNSDGGSSVNSKTLYAGDKIGFLSSPIKQGYTFNGWYNNTRYTEASIINSNITLKAIWISNDDIALEKAKESLGNINILKGGQVLSANASNCTISLIPTQSIDKITRGLSNYEIDINANIICGSASGSKTIKGIIMASSYKYDAIANANQANYDVTFYDGVTAISGYTVYNMQGTYLADCGTYGYAAINNADMSGYSNFKIRFLNDTKTIYVVSKR